MRAISSLLTLGLCLATAQVNAEEPLIHIAGYTMTLRPPEADKDKTKPKADGTPEDLKQLSMEYYWDDVRGKLIAITETGSITVAKCDPKVKSKSIKPANDITRMQYPVNLLFRTNSDSFKYTKSLLFYVFHDKIDVCSRFMYVNSTGSIGMRHFEPEHEKQLGENDQKMEWLTGMTLKTREPNTSDAWDKATVHSVEVYQNPITGYLLYATNKGAMAFYPGDYRPSPKPYYDGNRKIEYKSTCDVGVNKAGTPDGKLVHVNFRIEMYEDPYHQARIFISNTGSIAVTAAAKEMFRPSSPNALGAYELKVRKADQNDFTISHEFGLAKIKDNSTQTIIYVTEKGTIAVFAD